MNPVVQIFAIVLGIGIIWFSIKSLRKRTLSELQTGWWLLVGIVSVVLGIFPGIILWVAGLLGISWPPAILLLLAIVCLGLIVFGETQEINDLDSRLTEVTERLSIALYESERLEERIRVLEKESSQENGEGSK